MHARTLVPLGCPDTCRSRTASESSVRSALRKHRILTVKQRKQAFAKQGGQRRWQLHGSHWEIEGEIGRDFKSCHRGCRCPEILASKLVGNVRASIAAISTDADPKGWLDERCKEGDKREIDVRSRASANKSKQGASRSCMTPSFANLVHFLIFILTEGQAASARLFRATRGASCLSNSLRGTLAAIDAFGSPSPLPRSLVSGQRQTLKDASCESC